MDDISRVSRVEFALGRGQTNILTKQGNAGKGGKGRKAKSPETLISEDEFHRHAEPGEDSLESLDKDHVDLKA